MCTSDCYSQKAVHTLHFTSWSQEELNSTNNMNAISNKQMCICLFSLMHAANHRRGTEVLTFTQHFMLTMFQKTVAPAIRNNVL